MKPILAIVIILALAAPLWAAGAEVSPWGEHRFLNATDRSWRPVGSGGPTTDTVTATGTIAYTAPFQIWDGHLCVGRKLKFTTTNADTDSVRVILYRAPFFTTSALYYQAIDSITDGGRADTTYQQWMISLAGKGWAKSYWRLGYKKLMGVPKILGLGRGGD